MLNQLLAELAASVHAQASRLGAEILIGAELVTSAPTDHGTFTIELTCGSAIEVRTGVVATGVDYRRLEAPGVQELVGAGIHYGSAPGEAARLEGQHVVIVGGGNSAGQAALHLAEHARSVTIVIRAARALDPQQTVGVAEQVHAAGIASLVLWGDADRYLDAREVGAPLAHLLGAELRLLSGGHFLPLAAPADVAQAVTAFFNSLPE